VRTQVEDLDKTRVAFEPDPAEDVDLDIDKP